MVRSPTSQPINQTDAERAFSYFFISLLEGASVSPCPGSRLLGMRHRRRHTPQLLRVWLEAGIERRLTATERGGTEEGPGRRCLPMRIFAVEDSRRRSRNSHGSRIFRTHERPDANLKGG